MELLIILALVVLVLAVLTRGFNRSRSKSERAYQGKRLWPFTVRWFILREQKKRGNVFFLADDNSAEALFDPVYYPAHSAAACLLLGTPGQGGRRLMDRLVQGLSQDLDHVWVLSAGMPPRNDEIWSLPAAGGWNLWGPELPLSADECEAAQVNRWHLGPVWFDRRIEPQRLWRVIRAWTASNAWAEMRQDALLDLTCYCEALWPLICEAGSGAEAYRRCAYLFDRSVNENLAQLTEYLEAVGLSGGEWTDRVRRTLANTRSNETLGILWQFLECWARCDREARVPVDRPGRWLCIFPESFAAGAALAIELLLSCCRKPGLVVLDRLGGLLSPSLYLEQVDRLKRNGWTVILSEYNLGWVTGDDDDSSRLAAVVDNWLFGRTDGPTARFLEQVLGVEREIRSATVTEARGLAIGASANPSTTSERTVFSPLMPAREITELKLSQAVLAMRYPPAWEPNRVRILDLGS